MKRIYGVSIEEACKSKLHLVEKVPFLMVTRKTALVKPENSFGRWDLKVLPNFSVQLTNHRMLFKYRARQKNP